MSEQTIVLDVGARYGMHPSWNAFKGSLMYFMFEPDTAEAARLRENLDSTIFKIFETALGSQDGKKPFYLLKHRGLSSFLKPDLGSECFRRLKPGQAEIDKEIELNIKTIDSLMQDQGLCADFLKVDTEGTEQDVIEGASTQLDTSILGVRASCNFQPCFVGQKLFSDTHDYLLKKNFFLLNLDYRGYGYPRLGLYRKPDPIEPEDYRYGVLVAADGVWVKRPEWCAKRYESNTDEHDFSILKLASFCMLNHACDVGIDVLREHVANLKKRSFSSNVLNSKLYNSVKYEVTSFLGRWRTVPDEQWIRVQQIYFDIYNEPLMGGSDFYPKIQMMKLKLEAKAS